MLISEPRPVSENFEMSLLDVFMILRKHRRAILRNIIIAALVSVPLVFLLPVKYRAEAIILTPQQPQPSLTTMAQLTGMSSVGLPALSLLSGLGLRNPADLYVGILESRTIADNIVAKFDLKRVYGQKDVTRARKHLWKNSAIETSKDSLIHIRVEDREPRRAAEIANSYVDELSIQNSRLALTEASQRRAFYEQELAKEKDLLADAEVALKNTEQATGLVVPTGQAEAIIRSGALLRTEILSRQAQVEAMKTFAADDNPRFQIVKHELAALESQLSKVEQGSKQAGVLDLPTGQLPEVTLKYIRGLRDVKYHEALFEILSKQYEAARLDEAKSAPLIQIVDRAIVPERRSWPPRTILVLSATTFVAFVTSFWLLVTNNLRL
jgi:tyrosine-protein kinase Etk/Wzc